MTTEKSGKPLILLVDGHSLVFRAWFAIPERLSTSTGQDTRGAYGFLNTFLKTLRDHVPTHAAVVFDTRAPTFRDELFKEYKAQRPPTDPELHEQIPMVKQIMKSFHVPVYELDGYEADDLVGTICRKATEKGLETLILTGDADQLQLVDNDVKLLMYSGFGDTRVYDIEGVKERYDGLGPEFVAEIKALEGDPSDNIPGVKGVGKKAARGVLSTLGHFDSLFSNLDKVAEIEGLRGAKRIRDLLEEHKQIALDGLKLTTIVCDAPLEFDLDDAKFGLYDRQEVVDTLLDLEFRTIVRQVPDPATLFSGQQSSSNGAAGASGNGHGQMSFDEMSEDEAAAALVAPAGSYEVEKWDIVTTIDALKAMIAEVSNEKGFAFDTETTGMNPMTSELVGLSFSNGEGRAWYVPVGHDEGEQVPAEEALAVLRPLFEDPSVPKTAHNANFDMTMLGEVGIKVAGIRFDSMIAAALCGRRSLGLKQMALDEFRIEMTPISELIGTGRKQITMDQVSVEDAGKYAAADAEIAWRLWDTVDAQLDRHNQRNVFEKIELPLLPVIVKMQRTGMLIRPNILSEMSEELASELANIEQAISVLLGGRAVNLNSNQQLAAILIDEMGAPKTRRTKTGYSMDANALESYLENESLSDQIHELVSGVLRYRELSKLKSTYVDALPSMVNPRTGRIHTSFNQVGSATGRLSSTDPNVQNIPVRTDLGRRVRSAFVADVKNGWSLLAADYSQIELRILAHLSQEPGLLEAFKNGEDIHSATARAMYGESGPVKPEQRRIAKILNFGVIYGLGPAGVARQTDLTRAKGQEFIDLYFGKYPGIKEFIEQVKSQARQRGYAETVSGRRRYLPEIHSANGGHRSAAERVAVNMPIQGTAADVIKIAMVDIDNEMQKQKMKSQMLVQVHDELIFEVAPGEQMEVAGMARELMPAAAKLTVPLDVEVKTGPTWGDLE